MARTAAADGDSNERALATALFREGRRLMAEGRPAEACPKLEESERLDPGGGTLLNLALCHELEGRTATSWSEFANAISVARRDNREDRAAEAQRHMASLEPKLARLRLVVPADARCPGLVVRRDGAPVGPAAWEFAIPVDPGLHVIEAEAPGRMPWRESLAVSTPGETRAAVVPVLAPIPQEAPAPPRQAQNVDRPSGPRSFWQRSAGIALAVVGVGGLGLATFFGVRAKSDWDFAAPKCTSGTCTDRNAFDSWSDANANASRANVALIAGLVAFGGGVALWVTTPSSRGSARFGVGPTGATVAGWF
jgi:hypothetical protein